VQRRSYLKQRCSNNLIFDEKSPRLLEAAPDVFSENAKYLRPGRGAVVPLMATGYGLSSMSS
jgi:hypothetical protein